MSFFTKYQVTVLLYIRTNRTDLSQLQCDLRIFLSIWVIYIPLYSQKGLHPNILTGVNYGTFTYNFNGLLNQLKSYWSTYSGTINIRTCNFTCTTTQFASFYMYLKQILLIQVSSSGTVHTISHTNKRMQGIIFAAANRKLNNYMYI